MENLMIGLRSASAKFKRYVSQPWTTLLSVNCFSIGWPVLAKRENEYRSSTSDFFEAHKSNIQCRLSWLSLLVANYVANLVWPKHWPNILALCVQTSNKLFGSNSSLSLPVSIQWVYNFTEGGGWLRHSYGDRSYANESITRHIHRIG